MFGFEYFSFGYIDLADPNDLDKAMALNGADFQGRYLKIDKAQPKKPRDSFGGNDSFGNKSFGGDREESKYTLSIINTVLYKAYLLQTNT